MNGKILEAKVIAVHWNETDYATNELTLEVERPNGTRYMFVVPVDRMTDALPPRPRTAPETSND